MGTAADGPSGPRPEGEDAGESPDPSSGTFECPGAPDAPGQVTHLLNQISQGVPGTSDRLMSAIYEELRQMARRQMASERPGHMFQTTVLVHEAYLRLVGASQKGGQDGGNDRVHWANRGHFFRAAAEAMRRLLIDEARRRDARRHGGGRGHVPLTEAIESPASESVRHEDLLALSDALEKLSARDSKKADLVRLRYFTGLDMEAAAETLGVSPATAYRWWTYARAWLYRELSGRAAPVNSAEPSDPVGPSDPGTESTQTGES